MKIKIAFKKIVLLVGKKTKNFDSWLKLLSEFITSFSKMVVDEFIFRSEKR